LQAQQAVLEGASYLGVGPMFPSATKSFAEFADADFACAVAKQITLPCFAIGGINESNLDQVLRMGFHRIALSAAVINAPHPSAAARNLKSRLVAAAKSI
jgi:thiamine-phosphate pyrophosphorylase